MTNSQTTHTDPRKRSATVPIFSCALMLLSALVFPLSSEGDNCIECHEQVSPNIVADWQNSRHAGKGVGCAVCHGPDH